MNTPFPHSLINVTSTGSNNKLIQVAKQSTGREKGDNGFRHNVPTFRHNIPTFNPWYPKANDQSFEGA